MRQFLTLVCLVALAGCSQVSDNSFGVVWVAPGTSATLTINAQTITTPAAAPPIVAPVRIVPVTTP